MNTIAIDFESTYKVDKDHGIKEQGTWNYLHDPRTDIYMVSVVADNGFEFCGRPEDFEWSSLNGHRLLSHNSSFDQQVLFRLQELGVVPQDFAPAEWHCTADLSAGCYGPRALKDAASFWLSKKVNKDPRDKAKGKTWADFNEEDRAEMVEYALEDSRNCLALWNLLSPRWPQHERDISRINREIGYKGVHIDRPKLETYIAHLEECLAGFRAQIPWADTRPPLSPIAVKELCAELGIPAPVSMAKTSEDFARWLAKYGEQHPWATAMGNFRSCNSLLEKLIVMRDRIREDATMPLAWKYAGAGITLRFSGSDRFNAQNLSRDKQFSIVEPRTLLIPGEGNLFIASDLSQIEVRVLHWLSSKLNLGAGESSTLLDAIRQGYNPYEASAMTFGMWDGIKGTMKDGAPKLYQTVKSMTLGCGFGIGPDKFRATAPQLSGGEFTPNAVEAEAAVNKYRESNSDVVKLWWHLQSCLETAASRRKDYVVELPGGRSIIYRNPRAVQGDFKKEIMVDIPRNGKIVGNRVYGGLIAENLTQGLARDIFSWMVRDAYNAGYQIVMHTHDEIVVRCPRKTAEETKKNLEQLMSAAPPWIPDIPIGAEAKIMECYKK